MLRYNRLIYVGCCNIANHMNPQWQFNLIAVPLGISVLLLLVLIVIGLQQRDKPIAKTYLIFMGCLLVWMTGSFLEILTLNLQLSLLFADFSFLGITFMPVAWLAIVMQYNNMMERFNRWLPLIILFPILTNIMIWTNPLHQLWRGDSYRDLTTTWFPISVYDYGAWFSTIHVPFNMTITLFSIVLLLHSLNYQEQAYRRQIFTMLIALCLPLSVEVLYQLGFMIVPHFNASTLVFPISGVLTGWVVLRYRLLDLTPIAREVLIESLEDLVLVLDTQRRILDLNPAAHKHLFNNQTDVIGLSIDKLLPDHKSLVDQIKSDPLTQNEIDLTIHNKTKTYAIRASPIQHHDLQQVGWLLLLQDITDRRKTEEIFFAQVKQVTLLEERQRLARELHDSVNQTLFAASTLADLLPRAIEKKPEKVKEYAYNIQQLIHGATAEMRLILLELYPDGLIETDLGTSIRHLCDAYTGTSGTVVGFSTTANIYLEKDAQVALYRIAQEALNNIKQHTTSTEVFVSLTKIGDKVKLVIQDNGCGFDTKSTPSGHFGIGNMIERAEAIGANCTIDSVIDVGTTITVIGDIT